MLKPLLVAVLLTGLCTPIAAAAPPSTCLEPPVSDKVELCVDILPYGGREFAAYSRFIPVDAQVPATLKVVVQQRREMWPDPTTVVEKTVTGAGGLSAVTDGAKVGDDATAVRACSTGWTEISSRSYEVCTRWQTV
jgi:hypothetical protein